MRKTLLHTIALATFFIGSAAHAATMTVYKSPTCGCCAKWIEHVQKNGFTTKVVETQDMAAVKAKAGIPDAQRSCHTTMVGGYVVEGHVPASDIKRLLAQKPKARGIAVAGMPMGSPGMEHGDHREPYKTMLIGTDGKTKVFASH
ncbi:DUF411 domain-containing protein [Sphingomonas sp. LY29]|uniref:DUF411 domain-containing protein n=1 Tax=unclassified Sphingomonas TaxID=196159 RepID=UPI002ADEE83C|nr:MULTISPECIES: DUF411 domain-containing protein [unclassified Sphingomonas]MEA1071789.1 DUF411 domain-containing protein [Sphingomonas sp. LY160]WRP25520.1 DUF411 domain-containing protein [Sphingomonas sp. LY29]